MKPVEDIFCAPILEAVDHGNTVSRLSGYGNDQEAARLGRCVGTGTTDCQSQRRACVACRCLRDLSPDLTRCATSPAVQGGEDVNITEPLLDRVDELAGQIGQSRAAVINLAVMQMLQSGLRIEGREQ